MRSSQASFRECSREVLKKLVIHGAAHPDLDDLNGLGIFVPFVTDEQDLRRLGLQP